METSTIIATISLLVAVTTFFLTQLRPPKLLSQSGPLIKIYYSDYDTGGSFGIYVPVTFINKSSQTGSILNAAITLQRKDTPEQSYFMQWREFSKLSQEKNQWVFDEVAHALAISGKSTASKMVWFMWKAQSQPKLVLREGAYILKLYFWDKKGNHPLYETHQLFINQSIYENLESLRIAKKSNVCDIMLDLEIEQNRLLTEHEVKKLLG